MITPQDIAEKEFRMSFRGYNTEDVDNFLQEVYDCFDEIYNSNQDLKEKTGRLSDAVGQYKSMEDTLNNALNIAGKSADEIEDCANEKAAQIIRNAEITAQSIIAGAEQKIRAEEYRLENIKRETELYKEKIIQLLNAQLSLLDGYPMPSGSIPVKKNSAAESLSDIKGISDIDVSDIKNEKNPSGKSDDNGKNKKRDKANRKNSYDTEKTAVVNDIKKDVAVNAKIADEDETLRFSELKNTESTKKSYNSDKVDESDTEKTNNEKNNKDFTFTESKAENKTESKNTKSEKDLNKKKSNSKKLNSKKSKKNDFDTVLNVTEDTDLNKKLNKNLNKEEGCEEVSDDTVIIQSIGADLNGDTSTLPFVAPNENGGYTVQNQ